ncbi:orotidine-5'-phosphate decarboxylase [Tessaracoccus defluvii]|uniref:orotidine-5'-phosphate decarboxylase n=1 Tax=Tessaracoccus defluvii TaxID=1285901 RepID=UPI0029FECB1F|nr:orotidine-5'-phosphate decarboxylase [Tessaracoccus defluvii]
MTYATRLTQATADRGRLCVGIDPMPSVLDAWGLSRDVAGLEACARGIVEALGDRVAVFKPQSAFFEAYGSAGVAVLERLLRDIRAAGALSLLDVKRGDIGSSMAGYAAAHLGEGAPLWADAITVSPYLGVGALRPAIDAAVAGDRGSTCWPGPPTRRGQRSSWPVPRATAASRRLSPTPSPSSTRRPTSPSVW